MNNELGLQNLNDLRATVLRFQQQFTFNDETISEDFDPFAYLLETIDEERQESESVGRRDRKRSFGAVERVAETGVGWRSDARGKRPCIAGGVFAARERASRQDASRPGKVERVVVSTGNVLIDQYKPWYFGVAFAYLIKYGSGMPDQHAFAERERYVRVPDAPRVEPPAWVRIMARRVEGQLGRDHAFGFCSWSYVFRSQLNLSFNILNWDGAVAPGGRKLAAEEIERGGNTDMPGAAGGIPGCDGAQASGVG